MLYCLLFHIFRLWSPDFAIFYFKFGLYASKSSPGTPPEVWKPLICPKHLKLKKSKKVVVSKGEHQDRTAQHRAGQHRPGQHCVSVMFCDRWDVSLRGAIYGYIGPWNGFFNGLQWICLNCFFLFLIFDAGAQK